MSELTKRADEIAAQLGLTLTVTGTRYGTHFVGEKEQRWVFSMKLQRADKSYEFDFGQSIAESTDGKGFHLPIEKVKVPTMYDVLAAMQKYDVGSFEDFCDVFGYTNQREHGKIYGAVCKEYEAMAEIFDDAELELLSEIQ